MTKKMWNTIAALAAIVAASVTAPAFAQTASGRHQLTGGGGGQLFDIGDQFNDLGANFKKEMNLGARYQYNLSARWGIEGSFLYTPTNAELSSATRDVSVDTSYYQGNVLFNILPDERIIPFVTAGVGGVTLDVQGGGDTETNVGFNFGGGVSAPISERWSFRFDVRDFVYSVDNLNPGSVGALAVPASFDEIIHDLSFDFGVSFTF